MKLTKAEIEGWMKEEVADGTEQWKYQEGGGV
jgi:hypothetical protein